MGTFQSIKEIELALRKKDLERQISKEQLKLNYHNFQDNIVSNVISSTAISLVIKIGIGYIKNRFNK